MKLIIDIPDMYYDALKQTDMFISGKRSGKTLESVIYNAIGKGTPIIESEDTISRQAVLGYIVNDLELGDEENGADLERKMELQSSYDYIASLPSVQPKVKIGEWVSEKVDGEDWKGCKRQYYQPISCSKCHSPNHYKSIYCPNCGARMVKPQESEDEE